MKIGQEHKFVFFLQFSVPLKPLFKLC